MSNYIQDTSFAATLEAEMNVFAKALAERWIEDAAENLSADQGLGAVPKYLVRPANSYYEAPWAGDPKRSTALRIHVYGGDLCAFIQWAKSGQEGELTSVQCDGATGQAGGHYAQNESTGQEELIDRFIDCPIGALFNQIIDFAWYERNWIYEKLPKFDHNDVATLEQAHNAMIRLGENLALEPNKNNEFNSLTMLGVDGREIPNLVSAITKKSGDDADWMASWTGLAANRFKEGFLHSVQPTLQHQSEMAGCLANIYSFRAAIIESTRNNCLAAIQHASVALAQTETETISYVDEWKVLQGVGASVGAAAAFTGVGGAVGASIALIGFLGENLMGSREVAKYSSEYKEVAIKLLDLVDKATIEYKEAENAYNVAACHFANIVSTIHSYELELYDITNNAPDGSSRGNEGFTANVTEIMVISKTCMALSDLYSSIKGIVDLTEEADRNLTAENGTALEGDHRVIDMRDELRGFLDTTAARYMITSEQLFSAAERYAATDEEVRAKFEISLEEWEAAGMNIPRASSNHNDSAKGTDRWNLYENYPEGDELIEGVRNRKDKYLTEGFSSLGSGNSSSLFRDIRRLEPMLRNRILAMGIAFSAFTLGACTVNGDEQSSDESTTELYFARQEFKCPAPEEFSALPEPIDRTRKVDRATDEGAWSMIQTCRYLIEESDGQPYYSTGINVSFDFITRFRDENLDLSIVELDFDDMIVTVVPSSAMDSAETTTRKVDCIWANQHPGGCGLETGDQIVFSQKIIEARHANVILTGIVMVDAPENALVDIEKISSELYLEMVNYIYPQLESSER